MLSLSHAPAAHQPSHQPVHLSDSNEIGSKVSEPPFEFSWCFFETLS